MEHPKLINNISERVVDDIKGRLSKGTFVSIAAASFSIYAYEALKEELEQVEQLRFIFTSPAFIKDKSKKEKREFFIPKLNRERNLYGTDFELRLRNQLSQKAIAKECADWIRRKVQFRSKLRKNRWVDLCTSTTKLNGFTSRLMSLLPHNWAVNVVLMCIMW